MATCVWFTADVNISTSSGATLDTGIAPFDFRSIPNFRDIGGLRSGARQVRPSLVYRAGIPCFASETDRARLVDLAIADVIDLRTTSELELHGTAEQLGIGVRVHHLPVIVTTWDMVAPTTKDFADDPVQFLSAQYARMFDEGAPAIVGALTVIAAGRTTLVHCTAGKDRTGVLIAVLLGALGVSDADVADDYALSEAAMPHLRSLLSSASSQPIVHMEQLPVAYGRSPREAMVRTLTELRRQWHSPERYLIENGLSRATIAELRQLMLV